ncbi:MAG: hypothetical protein DME60_02750 [Verrucomicrobia bacterium]|nr:MAG: hypothetical protein DME60_02750 [Verrucomicrobiota bacterium]
MLVTPFPAARSWPHRGSRTPGTDLIIIGTRGHGAMFDLIVGGVAHAVVRDTPIPVLLVPLRRH